MMDYFPQITQPWQHQQISIPVTYPLDGNVVEEVLQMGVWRIENPGKPKLLFLHGWAEYALDMERIAAPFFDTCDIVALDARSHGLSDGPPSEYTMAERVQDILSVLQAIDFHPDIFIGHSLGANCTLGLSVAHPAWVMKAVLLDPSWNQGLEVLNKEQRMAAKEYWTRTMEQWNRFSERQLMRFADHSFPAWHPMDRQRWVEGKKMLKWHTIRGYDYPAPNWNDYIDHIACEGIVFMGDPANGGLVTREIAEASKVRWKGLREVIEIPGADHYVHHYAVEPIHHAIERLLGDQTES